MPGFYPVDEYDVAGFSVGLVDRKKMIDGTQMKAGDAIVGIRSSGVHSNGFSLVRKIFNIDESSARRYVPEFGKTLGEELLTPTKIYVKAVESLLSACPVKAISHITGGGFYENIPRMMTDGLTAKIEKRRYRCCRCLRSWPKPEIFRSGTCSIPLIWALACAWLWIKMTFTRQWRRSRPPERKPWYWARSFPEMRA